jgi:cytochrome b pre-mRNA-processing protein 3
MFSSWRRSRARKSAAFKLYAASVEQSRVPDFYARLNVPDTVDGRFDLIALHVSLVVIRLGREAVPGKALATEILDVMFSDMDQGLREMGVGDLGVGKKVRFMGSSLFGRIAAYEAGLAGDDAVLAEALRRNLYGTLESASGTTPMVGYVRAAAGLLDSQPFSRLLEGFLSFPPPPSGG